MQITLVLFKNKVIPNERMFIFNCIDLFLIEFFETFAVIYSLEEVKLLKNSFENWQSIPRFDVTLKKVVTASSEAQETRLEFIS